MELGVGGPEEEEEISMPMPIVSYAPPIIQEVSKLRLLGGTGAGAGEPAAAASTATAVTDAATTTVTVSGEENTGLTSVPPAAAATSEQTTHADAAATTKKKSVRYRECLKNHAANIGGHAIDGCGEFMPSGQEGTLEALKCAACSCHRNFHRREVQGADHSCSFCYNNNNSVASLSRKLSFLRHGVAAAASSPPLISAGGGGFESSSSHEQQQQHHEHDPHHGLHYPHPHHHHRHHMNIGFLGGAHPLSMLIPASQQHHPQNMQMQMRAPAMMVKKRFRTKFTQEQKDKMFAFAEKLGWRIQKHDEVAVQQICMELGVKRHVLKVWMHNNKNTLGKKIDST